MNVPVVREYADSTVLVAGGSSGIGLASVLAFIDAGVQRVAIVSRDPARSRAAREVALQRARGSIDVIAVTADATDVDDVQSAVDHIVTEFGRIDVLVSSVAARRRPELLLETPMADVVGILTDQAAAPLLLSRAVIPVMAAQGGGSIVTVASDAAKIPTPGESLLGAAMAAIVMFTRTAALEGRRHGIRANVVTPSLVSGTPTTEMVLSEGFSQKLFEKAAAQAAFGVVTPSDLAELIVFLCGPATAKMTGQAISLNGGISVI
jgi:2-hydroxycyclohexanecarboxyl-CoA dehydrogenase